MAQQGGAFRGAAEQNQRARRRHYGKGTCAELLDEEEEEGGDAGYAAYKRFLPREKRELLLRYLLSQVEVALGGSLERAAFD